MNAKIVKENGVHVSTSKHSGMQIWEYNGSIWAIFPKDGLNFAYLWGPK